MWGERVGMEPWQRLGWAMGATAEDTSSSASKVPGGAGAQASQHGHLKILKYLRSKGCQWDILSPVYAHQHGKETTFKWIVAQPDCPEFEERDLQSWWNTSHPDNCGA